MFQQVSGIGPVVYLGESIFLTTKVSTPTLCTVFLGATQILGTIVGGVLVDWIGRKVLLRISGIAMAICLAILGYYFWLQDHEQAYTSSWVPLLLLVVFILGYGIGFGPICWIMQGELLGPDIKQFAFGVAVIVNLVFQILAIFSFQLLVKSAGMSVAFWMYSLLCLLATVMVFLLPETKNKSLKEIQDELAGERLKNLDDIPL